MNDHQKFTIQMNIIIVINVDIVDGTSLLENKPLVAK
jgi:hypothetical protein